MFFNLEETKVQTLKYIERSYFENCLVKSCIYNMKEAKHNKKVTIIPAWISKYLRYKFILCKQPNIIPIYVNFQLILFENW